MGRLDAVVFDFDGTLVDTEWPIFERARIAAERLGADLTPELWATHSVGVSHGDDFWAELGPALGLAIDAEEWEAAHESVTDIPLARDIAPIVPGAVDLVAALHSAGVTLAVASGSERWWLVHHLDRFGLTGRFAALVGVDHPDVAAGKPAPDLFLAALAEVGADAAASVGIEDTARGIASAHAAGLAAVVAVPSRLTAHQDLSGATAVVASLADLTVASLAALT